MPQNPPPISDAEWKIMRVLWARSPRTANEVVEALAHETDWKPKTTKTLLARLVQKKALTYEKSGREFLFRPIVAESECVHAVSRSFLDKVFDGEVAPFLACILKKERLSAKQLEALKKLLKEAK